MPRRTRLALAPLLAAALAAALAACSPHVDGNGVHAQRVFDAAALPAFERLAVDLPRDDHGQVVSASVRGDALARQVVVRGDQNVIEHVELQVEAGRLRAVISPTSYTVVHPLQLWVQAPGLVAVEATAGAQVGVEGVEASAFEVTASAQAQVALTGAGGASLLVELSGGGRLDAAGYPADAVQVTLSGGAGATVWPATPVSGSATGAGSTVKVKGAAGCAAAPTLTLSDGATCGPL